MAAESPDMQLTAEDIALIRDDGFFRAKAQIMRKIRALLDEIYAALQEEFRGVELIAPAGFDLTKCQFVKGEHLDDCPYQYLDFPKHFVGQEKFTFRTLFWWGHHVIFSLILEGSGLLRYKQNLLSRYHAIAGHRLSLSLAPSLWEWKCGEGYTLELTPERRPEVAAVLSGRPFFKLCRFISPDDSEIRDGRLTEVGREAVRSLLPIITP
jgi:hypothetical protein